MRRSSPAPLPPPAIPDSGRRVRHVRFPKWALAVAIITLTACSPPAEESRDSGRLTLVHAPLQAGEGIGGKELEEVETSFTSALRAAQSGDPTIRLRKADSPQTSPGEDEVSIAAEAVLDSGPETDLLVWGEARNEGGTIEVQLNFTSRAEGDREPLGSQEDSVPIGFEPTFRLDPFPSSHLPELTGLLRGISATRDGNRGEALDALHELKTPTIRAVLAATLFTPARLSEFNSAELSRAAEYAGRGLSMLPADASPPTSNALRLAYAHATYALGERLRGQACVQPLESAGLNYAQFLQSLSGDAPMAARLVGYRGLGDCLLRLGQRGEGAASVQHLTRAVRVYNRGLRQISREDFPAGRAGLHFQRGLALYELGKRLAGDPGYTSLERSAQEFHTLLSHYTKESAPLSWASCQANLGQAEFAMGQKSGAAESIQHYLYAASAFGQSLEVYSRESMPEAWARTHENLGLAYSALGAAMEGPEAIEHLLRGVDHLNLVSEVATLEEDPELWAMTRVYLAKAQISLGQKVNAERAEEAYIQALRQSTAALEVFTADGHNRAWAVAQQSLGVACTRLSEYSDERKARHRLEDAVRAFQAALQVRSLEATPEDWGITQWSLANALILRSRLQESAAAVDDLRRAKQASLEALKAFPLAGSPGDYGRVRLTLAQSLVEHAEITTDQEAAKRASDEALWILIRTLAELPGIDDLELELRRELERVQKLRSIIYSG